MERPRPHGRGRNRHSLCGQAQREEELLSEEVLLAEEVLRVETVPDEADAGEGAEDAGDDADESDADELSDTTPASFTGWSCTAPSATL